MLKKTEQTRLLATPLLAVLVCVSVLVAGLSWQVLNHIQGKTQESVTNVLRASLLHTHDEITAWVLGRQEDARSWGESAALREKTQQLMDLMPEKRPLSPVQDEIWTLLAPMVDRLGYRGVTIVNSHQRVVSSLEAHQIGMLHPISGQNGALDKVFQGQSLMANPLHVGELWSTTYQQTMFVAAPMRDDEGGMMVAVIFEIDPAGEFSDIAAHGRIGKTGETWFFDAQGWLLSKSRFEEALRQQSLLKENQSSLLGIQTALTKEKVAGTASETLYIDSNYLVKQVAAVRLWDDVLNFGLMTSIEVDEAFEPFYRTQNLVLASVA
ncbi:MAG: cache domain-containing protein, partial [Mariprofundaceae bacterium]|nr:cache domain-containing protein [Mariprofundaceae bacterium]